MRANPADSLTSWCRLRRHCEFAQRANIAAGAELKRRSSHE